MWILEYSWVEIGVALAFGLSLLANMLALAGLARGRKQARLGASLQEQLEQGMQLINSSSMGMGRKLLHLERQLQDNEIPTLAVAPETTEARASQAAPMDESLQDAASLLTAGVAPDEVARRCGISRAEAALMKLMHSQVSRATAA